MPIKKVLLPVFTAVTILLSGCNLVQADPVKLADIPEYNGEAYTEINDNVPDFPDDDFTSTSFEIYSDLDSLGRCGGRLCKYRARPDAYRKKRLHWSGEAFRLAYSEI